MRDGRRRLHYLRCAASGHHYHASSVAAFRRGVSLFRIGRRRSATSSMQMRHFSIAGLEAAAFSPALAHSPAPCVAARACAPISSTPRLRRQQLPEGHLGRRPHTPSRCRLPARPTLDAALSRCHARRTKKMPAARRARRLRARHFHRRRHIVGWHISKHDSDDEFLCESRRP